MNLLITGFSGFVARHFLEYLERNNLCYNILGIDINQPIYDFKEFANVSNISFERCDLLDENKFTSIITEFEPDYVLHLASFSSVAYSWKYPAQSFRNNTNIFLNLIMAVKQLKKKCRILSIGSSEEYGNVLESCIPLVEEQALSPVSPYAVARVSQEMIAKVFSESYGVDIVLTRSFNHIGPYQDERFVIPSFIRRILNIKEEGLTEGVIETGDISVIRDFVDVRDVVEAYYILLTKGTAGEIYNICSGKGIALSEIVDVISKIIGIKVTNIINPDYVRPNDNKVIIGSNTKILNEFGWRPKIVIEDTIRDMINHMS